MISLFPSEMKSANNFCWSKKQCFLKPNLTPELPEFIGAYIGDGYISFTSGSGTIGFVGHPINDKKYYDYLSKLFKVLFNLTPSIKVRARGLRMNAYSNEWCYFLTKELGLCYGKGKAQRVEIPKIFFEDFALSNFILRGLLDTDGSVFTSNKKGSPDYPAIEFTTTSEKLVIQVKSLLVQKRFRVAGIRSYMLSNGQTCHRISLYGYKNICLFDSLIGFSNPYKQKRLKEIIKKWGRWDFLKKC